VESGVTTSKGNQASHDRSTLNNLFSDRSTNYDLISNAAVSTSSRKTFKKIDAVSGYRHLTRQHSPSYRKEFSQAVHKRPK